MGLFPDRGWSWHGVKSGTDALGAGHIAEGVAGSRRDTIPVHLERGESVARGRQYIESLTRPFGHPHKNGGRGSAGGAVRSIRCGSAPFRPRRGKRDRWSAAGCHCVSTAGGSRRESASPTYDRRRKPPRPKRASCRESRCPSSRSPARFPNGARGRRDGLQLGVPVEPSGHAEVRPLRITRFRPCACRQAWRGGQLVAHGQQEAGEDGGAGQVHGQRAKAWRPVWPQAQVRGPAASLPPSQENPWCRLPAVPMTRENGQLFAAGRVALRGG